MASDTERKSALAIRYIASLAVMQAENMSGTDRSRLFDALSLVMPSEEERAQAVRVAQAIRSCESEQLTFSTFLLDREDQ